MGFSIKFSNINKSKLKDIRLAIFLGLSGLVFIYFFSRILLLIFSALFGELIFTNTGVMLLGSLGLGLGLFTLSFLYLHFTKTPLTFIDLHFPTKSDISYVLAGLFVLFLAIFSAAIIFSYIGAETATHSVESIATSNPKTLLYFIPISLLLIGPSEELLYRNIIQKLLYNSFSPKISIIISSIIFSAVHLFAYSGGNLSQNFISTLNSLLVIFILSLIIGAVYYKTKNLFSAALLHGLYDSIIFLVLFYQYSFSGLA